ncbi:PQQ-dependent sugar dehydrogenase [Aliiroseovarius sp. PTFE2010]|uniref:PQQ-dependent sugar dehydrogenase n=1 Tax=Aliiroseovarius sp. PTFE2010 TaxID=3417190 RepID=UPI003CEC54AE
MVMIDRMFDGFELPWGFDFLPDGRVLVTEKAGRLWLMGQDGRQELTGLPEITLHGQGGLLDVTVSRDFVKSREIFLTYATAIGAGTGTALGIARLEPGRIVAREIFRMSQGSNARQHFGSRVVEAADGTLFVTIGDRGDADAAQDLAQHNGKVLRLNRSGTIPSDNPFVGRSDARPEIWSFGHRNPQGAALDPPAQLWTVEHGARGGDEINRITKGTNYGWPVISYGTHYSGRKIGEGTEKSGMAQPAHYWDPSIAPSGYAIHSGQGAAAWRGLHFVGSLKFDYISVLDPRDWSETRIESRATRRVRDVTQAPDGSVWFLSEDNGAVFRMRPQ